MNIQTRRLISRATKPAAVAIFGAMVLSSAAPAWAQRANDSLYLGMTYGLNVTTSCDGAVKCDRNGAAAKIYGGYRIEPSLAVEVTYYYMGEQQKQWTQGRPYFDDKTKTNYSVSGEDTKFQALGIGVNYETEVFDIFINHLRAGLAVAHTEKTITLDDGTELSGKRRRDRIFPYVGVGLSFPFTPSLRLASGIDLLINQDRTSYFVTFGVSGDF